MSTVKASAFNNAAASVGGIAIDTSGVVTGGLPYPNRNLLHNGAMQVAQRSSSFASISAFGYYTADRWNLEITSHGTWTQSVENDAPAGSGFRKSLKMLCTTAQASPAASSYLAFKQALEGQDVQRIRKGTASAQQVTVSFWVKSNVTGTYIAGIYDADNARSVSAAYSVSASATWERKTVTFPADATGAFDNDNAESLRLYFPLGAGSDYTSGSLATSWAAYTAANRFVGQVNVGAAINNYWQITGVQLEVGPVATEFEFKSYARELAECQRYYYRLVSTGSTFPRFGWAMSTSTTTAYCHVNNPAPMRTNASAVEISNVAVNIAASTYALTAATLSESSTTMTMFIGTTSGMSGPNVWLELAGNSSAAAYVGVSADL